MAKYDKKAALKIMIEAVKQYEEKLNDKQFLIIYRERKDIKTVQIPLHRITDSASNGSVFPVVTEHFSASSDHAFL